MRKRTLAREQALKILYQLEMNPTSVPEAIESFWRHQPDHAGEVRQFAELLVCGTEKHVKEIDEAIIRAAENWQLSRMAAIDRNIMRFAVFELLYLEDVPPKVTINEAVNLAKKFSQEDSGKFVNGVLDKITHTEKPHYLSPSNES